MSVDSYWANGMTEWRIYMKDVRPDDGIGPVTRQSMRDELVPMVQRWLESEAYAKSRKRAMFYAIAYEIRNTTTTADYRAKDALAHFAQEVEPDDYVRLRRAFNLRMESLRLLDGGN